MDRRDWGRWTKSCNVEQGQNAVLQSKEWYFGMSCLEFVSPGAIPGGNRIGLTIPSDTLDTVRAIMEVRNGRSNEMYPEHRALIGL